MPTSAVGGETHWWCPSLDDANEGTTTVADFGSDADDATLGNTTNTAWVNDTGAGGVRAIDFDGTASAEMSATITAANPSGATTISLWIKPDANVYGGLFDSATASVGALRIYSTLTDTTMFEIGGNTSETYTSGDLSGGWHHMVLVTSDSDQLELYIDGSSVDTAAAGANSAQFLATFWIGRTNAIYFAGLLDDFRIFASDIGSSGVSTLYDSGNGRGYDAGTSGTGAGAGPLVRSLVSPIRRSLVQRYGRRG